MMIIRNHMPLGSEAINFARLTCTRRYGGIVF